MISKKPALDLDSRSLQRAGNRWHLVTIRARSGDDHHRGRGAGAQFDLVWNLLDAHHYRYALRESDPLESRLDGGQQLEACAAVLLGNAPADAFDAALQRSGGISHQRDNGPIAFLEIPDEGFPEECLDVEAIGIDDGYYRVIGNRGISDPQLQIGDVSIRGGPYLREIQVQLSSLQVRLGPAQPRVVLPGRAKIG